jgi:DNA polymerase-4
VLARLEQVLDEQSKRLGAELRERNLRGRTIGIKVRLDDWTTVTRVHTITVPTDDGELIAATALSLLRAYDPPRPVRLIGVKVASFADEVASSPAEPEALSLLADAA